MYSSLVTLSLSLSLISTSLAKPWGGRPGGWGWGPPHWGSGRPGKAAYFLENNPAGSSIVALQISQDGSLSDPVRTSTGGVGALEINATSGVPMPIDSLGGQGAVTVGGDFLFTVNAGSDTLVVFWIDPEDPYHPKIVGSPVPTVGEFPTSVAYSEALKTACVLTGGAKAGITCYTVDPFTGLHQTGPFRQFPISVINETTPAQGPPGSTGDIYFNPDSSAVFASVKGSPTVPGTLVAYSIADGEVSTDAVYFVNDDILLDFGAVFLNETTLLLSDAGVGGHILNIPSDLTKISAVVDIVIPTQKAACWAAYSPSLDTAYILDAGAPYIYTVNPSSGALETPIEVGTDLGGVLDGVVSGEKFYALAAVDGLMVVDLKEKTVVQFLNLTGFGDRQFYQGLAIW